MKKEELEGALRTDKLVVVDFYADWCGPCQMLMPQLDEIAATMNVEIIKVNVDKEKELVQAYEIKSIPTLFLYKDGVRLEDGQPVHAGNLKSLVIKYV